MDNFNSRDREEVVFDIIRHPVLGAEVDPLEDNGAQDGSHFLNVSGPGIELERREESQTSIDCDDDSQIGEHPPQSGEVY